ncbi:hypothetical protein GCM10023238_27880 [Streptomyces heliomycini]
MRAVAAIDQGDHLYDDPKIIADASRNLGEAMFVINCDSPPRDRALRQPRL